MKSTCFYTSQVPRVSRAKSSYPNYPQELLLLLLDLLLLLLATVDIECSLLHNKSRNGYTYCTPQLLLVICYIGG